MKINLIVPVVVVMVVDRIGTEKQEAWKAAGRAARQDGEGTTTTFPVLNPVKNEAIIYIKRRWLFLTRQYSRSTQS